MRSFVWACACTIAVVDAISTRGWVSGNLYPGFKVSTSVLDTTRWSVYLRQAEQFTFCIPLIGLICIWTLATIESACSCRTPNSSTKFRHNPSTTFWNVVLFLIFGIISQLWRITLKILVSVSGSSPKSNQFVRITHPTCPSSFVWNLSTKFWNIMLLYSFWPHLSMVKNHFINK